MDNEQRKYLLERVKQEYNSVTAPLKNGKQPKATLYNSAEMFAFIKEGNLDKIADWYGNSGSLNIQFKPKNVEKVADYTELLKKLSDEKNKVLDTIMLGELPNAADLLRDFVSFLKTETEKVNNGN